MNAIDKKRFILMKQRYMLVQISTDQVICLVQGDTYTLPQQNIEKTCGPRLLEILDSYKPQTLFVINGPGSFTTLRVCCLVLNLLKKTHNLTLKETTKIDMFTSIYNTHTTFEEYLALTIGQRKNCRLYHFPSGTHKPLALQEWQEKTTYLIDPVVRSETLGDGIDNARMLQLRRKDKKNIVFAHGKDEWLIDFTAPYWKVVTIIHPHYFIEPVSKKS